MRIVAGCRADYRRLAEVVQELKNARWPAGTGKKAPAPDIYLNIPNTTFRLSERNCCIFYEFTAGRDLECKKQCTPAQLYQKACSVGTIYSDIKAPAKSSAKTMPCSFLLASMIDDPEILFQGWKSPPFHVYLYKPKKFRPGGAK